jgi:peptidase S41-like protein/PDZ domain-containing protein
MKRLLGIFFAVVVSSQAQLTTDQKVFDFQMLASLYAKQYAPYEWKRDVVKFDLLNLKPWLDRARTTRTDIDFWDLCAEYVASLNDAHDSYVVPSEFIADLGFDVDIYDGRPLIEFVSRFLLPQSRYPFQAGDELISVDGKPVQQWLAEFAKVSSFANPRSTDRWNAQYLTVRSQDFYPRAGEVGDTATVVIKRRGGANETYVIPWTTDGLRLVNAGPVLSPRLTRKPALRRATRRAEESPEGDTPESETLPPAEDPAWMKPWLQLHNYNVSQRLPRLKDRNLRGFAELAPIFALPQGFRQRRGRLLSDFFYSGAYDSGGKTIGYIRIPAFLDSFSQLAAAVSQFDTEIAFMRANTDALVVDVMRNPGGYGCYAQALAQRLIPYPFHGLGEEVRVTREDVLVFYDAARAIEDVGAEQWQIDLYNELYKQVAQAYKELRGRTGPIPICAPSFDVSPSTDRAGNVIAYEKPLLILTDEFSTSAAEVFAAILQDAGRGRQFGWRTAGAGGSINGDPPQAGIYSESFSYVTRSLLVRQKQVATPDFPTSAYIENIGVRPDKIVDYMTEDNLLNRGRSFVDAFTNEILSMIQ